MAAMATIFLLTLLQGGLAQDPASITVYFGSGCFWHVQHEFIKAEQSLLNRDSSTYTALTGYAGGNRLNSFGHACYGDYGGLGHTEVVVMTIPSSKLADFAVVFWDLFVGKNRVDVMDIGPDYRAAIGVPGGFASQYLQVVNASQAGRAARDGFWFELKEGQGDDPDTLGQALVWVYDTERYPFYQAEVYHQFHDDFMPGGNYPQSYNALQAELLADQRIVRTQCDANSAPMSAASLMILTLVACLH